MPLVRRDPPCPPETTGVSAVAPSPRDLTGRTGAAANRHLEIQGVNEEELKKRLEMLRIEHRDLDAAIDALTAAGSIDQLQIARLKKRKLKLKDQIAMVEDYLIPDIIA